MKTFTIYLFIIILFFSTNSYSQKTKPVIFTSVGYGGGAKFELNYRQDSNLFSIFFIERTKEDPDAPSDYIPPRFFLSDLYGEHKPFIQMQSFGTTYGKTFSPSESFLKFNLKIGLAYNLIDKPENYQHQEVVTTGEWLTSTSSNYSYETNHYENVGLIINPMFQINISRVNAISLGLSSNINQKYSTFSFDFMFDFGRMRDKKPKKEKI
jgi:hypothetical protein